MLDNTEPSARPEPPAGPELADLGGMPAARQWGSRLARRIGDWRAGRIPWSHVDPGCLLAGPPGTGKTTFARALAATCRLPLVEASFADWQSHNTGHLCDAMQGMRASFALAARWAPCILFIDELDSLPSRDAGGGRQAFYTNAFVNALLKAFDGLRQVEGVVVVSACNDPAGLDPALTRSGRMDRKIAVALPDADEALDIVRFHLTADERRTVPLPPGTPLGTLCHGLSGADIAKLVREARNTARDQNRALAGADLIDAADPPAQRLAGDDERRLAVHEAGRAVVALRLDAAEHIVLAMRPRPVGIGAAGAARTPPLATRADIMRQLAVLLAGRAAEEALLGQPSAAAGGGAQSELAAATRRALDAITRLGFSRHASLAWNGDDDQRPLALHAAAVQAEVEAWLADARELAHGIIARNIQWTDAIARALVERRALAHNDLLTLDRRPQPTTPVCIPGEPCPTLQAIQDVERELRLPPLAATA